MKKIILTIVFVFSAFTISSLADHQTWHVNVQLDESKLSKAEVRGSILFNKNCAACHGENGSGSLSGPPLVHKIYEPSHHDNKSFRRAIAKGVRSHHWGYGDMPAQPQVAFGHVSPIIAFVRAVQRQNGID